MTMLCLFAHHRCASSWSNDILRNLSEAAGWKHEVVHRDRDFGGDLAQFCRRLQPDVLTFSNARAAYPKCLPDFVGMHLVRDPRDVLVSSYYSHKYSHSLEHWPELAAHRRLLHGLSKEAGLRLELDCRAEQFAEMGEWDYFQQNVLECKVETLVANPAPHFAALIASWGRLETGRIRRFEDGRYLFRRTVNRLLRKVGLPRRPLRSVDVPRAAIAHAVRRNAFRRKSGGRASGDVDIHHHYRAGRAGDWRRHFFPGLAREFKRRHGDLLVQLGYEQNLDW